MATTISEQSNCAITSFRTASSRLGASEGASEGGGSTIIAGASTAFFWAATRDVLDDVAGIVLRAVYLYPLKKIVCAPLDARRYLSCDIRDSRAITAALCCSSARFAGSKDRPQR